MDADFGTRLRSLLVDRRMSLRGAARALNYDVAYLSRVANNRQRPSDQLVMALEELLEAEGELQRPAHPGPPYGSQGAPFDPVSEMEHMKASLSHLLKHADRHGGDTVASAAVQVWQCARGRLDSGDVPDKAQSGFLSAVSEAAQVAGWLLFDAGKRDAARQALLESHMLARHAGDRPKQWFALDMLAMLGIECGRSGEAQRIADELLGELRVPPRVALIARVRRARALAQLGDRPRAIADLGAARGGLGESMSSRDPEWAWWVNDSQVAGHTGESLLDLTGAGKAIPEFLNALDGHGPRGVVLIRIELLRCYAMAKAWDEAETEMQDILPLLPSISSGRNRHFLRRALRAVERSSGAPAGVLALVGDVREADSSSARGAGACGWKGRP